MSTSPSYKDERFRGAWKSISKFCGARRRFRTGSDRKIIPGTSWAAEIDHNIETADVILLVVSTATRRLSRALKMHEAESAVVIPVFVRPMDLTDDPLMGLQGLPKDAVSITEWQNEDLGWRDVARGLRVVVDELLPDCFVSHSMRLCTSRNVANWSGRDVTAAETFCQPLRKH
jgi:replicative DNA helicase